MNQIINMVSAYVSNLLVERLPRDLCYHNPSHTLEVVSNATEIGNNSGLSEDEMEILLLAAWFHDTGFIKLYEGHEEKSAEIAEKFLKANNYPEEKIQTVKNCISKTKLSNKPSNILEYVLCDSDLAYLGKKNFFDRYESLRDEWRKIFGRIYNEKEWLELNLDFFLQHHFYTEYARKTFSEQKKANLEELKKMLAKNNF